MAGHWTDSFSYVTGAVRRRDVAYVALVSDEMAANKSDHCYVSAWQRGRWVKVIDSSTNWSAVASVVCQHPVEQGVFLGLGGEVLCAGSGDVHEEFICQGEGASPEHRGMMRGLGVVGGRAYAVGMQRQAYRRDEGNKWTCIDATARPAADDPTVYSFEAIAGFSADELYAVGRRGEIWSYVGSTWAQEASPTNMILTSVCCAEDGQVYAAGRQGTLLRGRRGRWELMAQVDSDEDFWGLVWYSGTLYASTMRRVFRLKDNRLERVDFGADRPSSCFALSAADGVLWSIGAKDVMSFDGRQWARID